MNGLENGESRCRRPGGSHQSGLTNSLALRIARGFRVSSAEAVAIRPRARRVLRTELAYMVLDRIEGLMG